MADQGDFDEDATRRAYGRPYTSKHPVPTIQGYREHRAELDQRLEETENAQNEQDEQGDSRARRAFDSVKAIIKNEDTPKSGYEPYSTANRNAADRPKQDPGQQAASSTDQTDDAGASGSHKDKEGSGQDKSATETAAGHIDPKQKRKDMKKIKRTGGGREVTDPVTHLPLIIHDRTDKDLDTAPENEPASNTTARTSTGLSGATKSQDQLEQETKELQKGYTGMQKLFPPPDFDDTKKEMMHTYRLALTAGLSAVIGLSLLALLTIAYLQPRSEHNVGSGASWDNGKAQQRGLRKPWIAIVLVLCITVAASVAMVVGVSAWLSKKIDNIFEDETWDAARQEEVETNNSDVELPESVAWLNSLLASIWPLINPDLFASLVDTLEDVMQASLPKVVRMVSVDDIGQGSESFRILGMRWLPTGAASQAVDAQGNLQKAGDKQNDRTAPGEGQIDDDTGNEKVDGGQNDKDSQLSRAKEQELQQRRQEQQAIKEGMEAEEGDFVNMELAFAYRARSSGKSIMDKAKNAHLYLKFYLPGGIAVPVWVELRGIIGTMRLRLQLTPDPPFFSLCTLTFLGQPRANLSCIPLSKHSLNLMDVPLISSFVQSAIDAALAEYVAPKSLTLDLKDMLLGDDFKKDTVNRGVVMLFIKRARGFKEGDGGIGPLRGASDAYVTVSWAKFGKPVASTRIIVDTQEPDWHEWHSILVSPDELNAEEQLRVQLWDSDKWTADDDLGRVELDLKDLMHSAKTKNRMCDREDGFTTDDPDESMPGTLTWSVGYFAKAHITPHQLDEQKVHPDIRTKDDLKKMVTKMAKSKLREATSKDESKEINQQRIQDYKEQEDEMMISTPPPDDLLSGILSIQIHNITGLEVQKLNKSNKGDSLDDREDEAEHSDSLPDSYCTVILNHQKIYRTRTKPKNAKPFFNAGTERFVSNWKTTEIMVSVRDSREREDDPLLGVIFLRLDKVFAKRSQVAEVYPLAGGIGYGRARISLVWRSVELKLPKELTGWDYGTLEIKSPIKVKNGASLGGLEAHRIKLRTNLGKAKMHPGEGSADSGAWHPKHHGSGDSDSVFLAVRKRYASALVIEFRKSSFGPDSTPAFAVLWLKEIADEEDKTLSLKVWEGGKDNLKRAESCCDYVGLKQNEQALGEIEMSVKFWTGLSGYHKKYAEKQRSADVRDVMECLDTVNDEKMNEDSNDDEEAGSTSDSDTDSAADTNAPNRDLSPEDAAMKKNLRKGRTENGGTLSEESDDSTSLKDIPGKIKKRATSLLEKHKDGKDDGSRGVRAQAQDYKNHHKQLHRKHRGIMQWKGARTLDWMVGRAKRGKGRMEGLFEHSEKDQGIETEV